MATPLYLLARHARDRAEEAAEIDPDSMEYARRLGAVQIRVVRQWRQAETGSTDNLPANTILHRDGKLVETLGNLPEWVGMNPFEKPRKARSDPSLEETSREAAEQFQAMAAKLTPAQRATAVRR